MNVHLTNLYSAPSNLPGGTPSSTTKIKVGFEHLQYNRGVLSLSIRIGKRVVW